MADCQALLKSINSYINKIDDELTDALDEAGFINTRELTGEITTLEELIARALTGETRFIMQHLRDAVDLGEFAAAWIDIKIFDNTDNILAQIFYDSFMVNVPKIATSYVKEIDSALTIEKITKRTLDWAKEWSEELGRLMKLATHDTIEHLLTENLRVGNSVADFTRDLMDNGIRNEYHRARAA
ncbi:MAG: hypothetical protein FWD01_04425, partial [Defluviitaleaceae bacterium]|nr:hypothetical protein [Defluviitaleaceae bacterium]